jgi:UDP-2-acetamido-2,6-beta-L-arabino-hexul-4-ose reductase
MVRIGITGQVGFIGTHLYNTLGMHKEEVERVPFQDDFFQDQAILREFTGKCDVIVHMAGVNRFHDPKTLYETNVALVKKLIEALNAIDHKPHVVFSSSTQEERDNPYGKSKLEGRKLFIEWAKKSGAPFTGMVIPNVFGPFGMPFYNSVVATFSHQMANNLEPKIDIDAELALIYVNDLVSEIWKVIKERVVSQEYRVAETTNIKVSKILEKMVGYRDGYMKSGILPDISGYFDLCLFNTFRSFLPVEFFPKQYTVHADNRGQFVELVKTPNGGQTSYSSTKPGITRGNHFHVRKVERFMVVQGEAVMRLRRIGTDRAIEYQLSGTRPAFVDVPVWYTHNITNTGKDELYTVFWINELFNRDDPDTFFESV